ncbi:ecto-ADP-ribosyltransferase 5-like [Pagrus major]|uniref:ecto-ADP-ribosyltransferase 5-like n=1 Tax=Pagrus major TaxID=143350 RepID=UPI003CC882C5
MADDAVDDMYSNCKTKMAEMVKHTYFKRENFGEFARVWNAASTCATKTQTTTMNLYSKDKDDMELTKDHIQAICVYTSDSLKFYKTLNNAVQTDRAIYGTFFLFHSLHFWLTSAVQILNKKCDITYRRTSRRFTGNVGDIVRFGFFASSSIRMDLKQFGKETCFKIFTCSGGAIEKYSVVKSEMEVLIPPYEKFMIKEKIEDRSLYGLTDCNVVYILEGLGVFSNLDCHISNLHYRRKVFHWWRKQIRFD